MKMKIQQPIRSMNDLRAIVCEDIQRLREGKIEARNLNAVVHATGTVIRSVSLELAVARLLGRNPKIGFIEVGDKIADGKK